MIVTANARAVTNTHVDRRFVMSASRCSKRFVNLACEFERVTLGLFAGNPLALRVTVIGGWVTGVRTEQGELRAAILLAAFVQTRQGFWQKLPGQCF